MIRYYLSLAASAARPDRESYRCAYVGAVAVRKDGAVVRARNGTAKERTPFIHAEARLLRKCDRGAHIYVARVQRDGSLALARPCPSCMRLLRAHRVHSVSYSTNNGTYETIRL